MISIDGELSKSLLSPIDYSQINKILDDWKYKSIDYLQQWLRMN